MPSPPIQLFLTTIASQPALRQRQEYLLRTLQIKKIPFKAYDLASDEQAKRLWKRKAPPDKQQLPGILVGNTFPGVFAEFEEAVEYNELDKFLRLNEEWDEDIEAARPSLPEQPIGVPGVMMPEKMTGQKPSNTNTPEKRQKAVREGEFDVGTELVGYGLQGVKVTHEDLAELVAELGLDEAAAADLIHGLKPSDEDSKADRLVTASTSEDKTAQASESALQARPVGESAVIEPSGRSTGLGEHTEMVDASKETKEHPSEPTSSLVTREEPQTREEIRPEVKGSSMVDSDQAAKEKASAAAVSRVKLSQAVEDSQASKEEPSTFPQETHTETEEPSTANEEPTIQGERTAQENVIHEEASESLAPEWVLRENGTLEDDKLGQSATVP